MLTKRQIEILKQLISESDLISLEELIEMSEPLAVNDRYDFITANDVADEDDMLLFAIIGITYDVVKLAYVSRIKG